MRHVRQPAAREISDVQEGGVDEVFYAGLLAGVGHGFALGHFDVFAHGFPEVGDEEDGVGAGYGGESGFNGRHVGLGIQVRYPCPMEELRGLRTVTISTPAAAISCAAGLLVSRVTPRSFHFFDRAGSARMVLMTEPPWLPVAPKTVRISDIVVRIRINGCWAKWFRVLEGDP